MARPIFQPRLLEVFNGRYGRSDLVGDAIAGVTVRLIALPLALALGIASIPARASTPYPPPAVGLFTAIFAGLVISALGGSRVQIGGPTAAFIPIVLLIIEKHGYSGLVLATLMAGGILVVMGLARMGTLIKFIPGPVTSGFTTGIAVSIMATQAADFLGITGAPAPPREFLHRLSWLWELRIFTWPRSDWRWVARCSLASGRGWGFDGFRARSWPCSPRPARWPPSDLIAIGVWRPSGRSLGWMRFRSACLRCNRRKSTLNASGR